MAVRCDYDHLRETANLTSLLSESNGELDSEDDEGGRVSGKGRYNPDLGPVPSGEPEGNSSPSPEPSDTSSPTPEPQNSPSPSPSPSSDASPSPGGVSDNCSEGKGTQFIKSASVTVETVILHENGMPKAFLNVPRGQRGMDLLNLGHSVSELLSSLRLPEGSFTEIRMIIHSTSLTLTDGRTSNFLIPSGADSGLKIHLDRPLNTRVGVQRVAILIPAACHFVAKGNPTTVEEVTGFLFAPPVVEGFLQ